MSDVLTIGQSGDEFTVEASERGDYYIKSENGDFAALGIDDLAALYHWLGRHLEIPENCPEADAELCADVARLDKENEKLQGQLDLALDEVQMLIHELEQARSDAFRARLKMAAERVEHQWEGGE